jgi:ABC-type antimicrobial peptide transport system permease subunit
LQGNARQSFTRQNDIVITDELAEKLFHTTENVVGRQVNWNRFRMNGIYTVAGVIQKPPANSTLQFDVLFNYEAFIQKNEKLQSWKNGGPETYIQLRKAVETASFNVKITNYLRQKGGKEKLFIQNFADRYLHGQYNNGIPSGGRIGYVKLFSAIAVFILLIACINFINLSTAKAMTRLKEVGIKKVMGAGRVTLILQYFAESLLMALLSLIVALPFAWLLLPEFNAISGKHLTLLFNGRILTTLLGMAWLTGLLAGIYPALYLSGFQPVKVLKGKVFLSLHELWVRKGLVLFQFTVSMILIISAVVIYQQFRLIQYTNLGYQRDHVIYFEKKELIPDIKDDEQATLIKEQQNETMLQEVRNVPGVISAAAFRHNIAAGRDGGTTDVMWAGKNPDQEIQFTDITGGYDFIETMGMQIMEGRSYSKDFGNETSKIIFNETAIAVMGLTHPIGKTVRIWGEDKQIIGVVRNFNFQSLYEAIKPCFIELNPHSSQAKLMVKVRTGEESKVLSSLKRIYQQYNPGLPFDYHFMDEDYQALYASEKKVQVLSKYFTFVIILISCLGLFGLSAFTLQKRYREIGIRKVLGSANTGILWLLWKDFSQVIVLSLLTGIPISFLIVKKWLNNFAFRIDLSLWYFILPGFFILIVTWLTVGSQTINATRIKPAESLRNE